MIVSVVDLGNLVSVRFSSADDATARDVKISDVIAPGVGFRRAITGTPLVYGVLASAVPKLADHNGRALRIGVFFGIDVPIFSLSRKKPD